MDYYIDCFDLFDAGALILTSLSVAVFMVLHKRHHGKLGAARDLQKRAASFLRHRMGG